MAGTIPCYVIVYASWLRCQVRYGWRRLHMLLRREGWPDNHKRVHRLSCSEGLNLRSERPRRNRAAASPPSAHGGDAAASEVAHRFCSG
ncbi:IS3 family transposase [Hymenobacter baengnokdamensis]|uniref:IS3 family transposase n=1 Tax=Hymenobacter baengnokdamensis TaxID=2615203 RepID=UPI001244600C